MNNKPIGVLDSGIGGLTVVREIISLLPNESIVYIGDSKNSPYGKRSKDEIYTLACRMIDFLLNRNTKLIVIACNTITVSNINRLRLKYPEIPLIGTVPVVKKAAVISNNKRIGILSTTVTAKSNYQKELINQFGRGCEVFNYGTDDLVPLIEKGGSDSREIIRVLQKVLLVFKNNRIDTLALGCTHFPFLRNRIETILGKNIKVLDSGQAIARQTARILENNDALAGNKKPEYKFLLTGNEINVKKMVNSYFENKLPGKLESVNI